MIPGEPIMLDALGRYRLYHGDLGRSAVIGEPTEEMRRRNRAMAAGWARAYEMIKPGVTGAAVTDAVLDTVRREGFAAFMLVVPHSIGLEHTDHPLPIGLETPGSKGDFGFPREHDGQCRHALSRARMGGDAPRRHDPRHRRWLRRPNPRRTRTCLSVAA